MTEETMIQAAVVDDNYSYTEDLKLLAQFRQIEADATLKLKQLRQAFENSIEYQANMSRLREAQQHSDDMTNIIKANAIQEYLARDNKHPHSHVDIRMVTRLVYETPLALEWCKENLTGALKLDYPLFEKHARAIAETAPLDFVEIEKQPQATIATDLSEYLPPEDNTPIEIDFDKIEPIPV